MALFPASLDYTDKDATSLRARLRALVRVVFPEWSDESVADFGNILLEAFAFTGDVLTYYQDNQARESRIASATQRRSLIGLVKLLGFTPSTASAATTNLTLSLDTSTLGSVTIPAGTAVSTLDVVSPVSFQLLADAPIPAGDLSVSVDAENSANAEDLFTSDTQADQEFILSATPYLDGSAVVIAGNGAYVQVADFLNSESGDRHYALFVDQAGAAHIRFGDGLQGAIPAGDIDVTYKTGGGAAGNLPAGALQRISGSFYDSLSNPVTISVTNPAKADGGSPAMSNAQIKQSGPASIRAPRNSVSQEDFVINAKRVPGVARALMLTSNQYVGVEENTGDLYVVPEGGGVASDALLSAVRTMVTVTYPPTLTFEVSVFAGVYRPVDVQAVVFLARGTDGATARANVLTSLAAFFAIQNPDGSDNPNIDFGANLIDETGTVTSLLAFSDLFNAVRDSAGIVRVGAKVTDFLLNDAHDDVLLNPREFPVLGNVTLINGLTGAIVA